MTKEQKQKEYSDYGADYIAFIIERDGELKRGFWDKMDFPEFCQTMANANYPPFDPELTGIKDDGNLYECALVAAWKAVQDYFNAR